MSVDATDPREALFVLCLASSSLLSCSATEILLIPPPPRPPFDIEPIEPIEPIEHIEPIEPPWQAIKEWIPDDEPDPDWFDQSPQGALASRPILSVLSIQWQE